MCHDGSLSTAQHDGTGAVAKDRGAFGSRPVQPDRRDIGRKDQDAAGPLRIQPHARKIQRLKEAQAGRIDVEGRNAPTGKAQPVLHQNRRRGDGLLHHAAGADNQVELIRPAARHLQCAFRGPDGHI